MCFKLVGEKLPRFSTDSRLGDGAEESGEMFGRLGDKGSNPVGPGVVERHIETLQCPDQLDSTFVCFAELVTSLLFVFDELGEAVSNGRLGFHRDLVA
jgi:hypothetical protein